MFKIIPAMLVFLTAGMAGLQARNYVIFVHGTNTKSHCTPRASDGDKNDHGGDGDSAYWVWSGTNWAWTVQNSIPQNWGPRSIRFVNYDGTQDYRSWSSCGGQNMLDQQMWWNCTWASGNQCFIVCHSAGCAVVDYYLDRMNMGNFHIGGVIQAGSGANGSNLAQVGQFVAGVFGTVGDVIFHLANGMAASMTYSNSRWAYSHNSKGIPEIYIAGYNNTGPFWWAYAGNDADGVIGMDDTCNQDSNHWSMPWGGATHNCQDYSRWNSAYTWFKNVGLSRQNNGRWAFNDDHGATIGSMFDMYNWCAWNSFCN